MGGVGGAGWGGWVEKEGEGDELIERRVSQRRARGWAAIATWCLTARPTSELAVLYGCTNERVERGEGDGRT